MAITAAQMIAKLKKIGSPERAKSSQRFFKTGKGEYGEGDLFLGVTVPQQRTLARGWRELSIAQTEKLMKSKFHEARLLAIFCFVARFQKGDEDEQENIFKTYLRLRKHINNWDLVDSSAPQIVGAYLFERSRTILTRFVASKDLWERRIAIIATQHFIRQGDLSPTFVFAKKLLNDKQDLIHKAVGWMLREAGQKDKKRLVAFLNKNGAYMPRMMLRYAIEKFPLATRKAFLNKTRS